MSRTRQACLAAVAETLRVAGLPDARLEARRLIEDALAITGVDMIQAPDNPVSEAEWRKIRDWTDRRAVGEPLAYLSGTKDFYGLTFAVGPGVLVPRPETELLVDTVLHRAPTAASGRRVADLGAGSGCVGLAVIHQWSVARLTAVDRSEVCCDYVRRNATSLNIQDRVRVVRAELPEWRTADVFDVITANPPYIPADDPAVEAGVRRFEPHEALYAGHDGLDAIRAWTGWARDRLRAGGLFACEFGAGQSDRVGAILKDAGFVEIQILKDYGGIDRVISARKAE